MCRRYAIGRKMAHSRVQRFLAGGVAALADRSHVRRETDGTRSSADGAAESMSVEGLRQAGPTQYSSGRSKTAAIPHPPTCGVIACRTLNLGSSEAAMRAHLERVPAVRTCSQCCTLRTLADPPAHAPSGPSSRSAAAALLHQPLDPRPIAYVDQSV